MLILFALFYSLLIYLYIYIHPNYLQIICDLPEWWAFLTCYGFKSHVNVAEGLESVLRTRGSGIGRRRLAQALSINTMINYRQSRTRLKLGSYWSWHGGRFMNG